LFDDLRREMNDLMGRFFTPEGDGRELQWLAARSNLVESDKDYEITIDLPGMKTEDFEVEIRDGNLWITGQRKLETLPEGKTYRRVSCSYGRFEEVIPLNVAVKADKVAATYKDGVLHIHVPKDETAQPKRIEVKSE
jgi:HSP20 family protein